MTFDEYKETGAFVPSDLEINVKTLGSSNDINDHFINLLVFQAQLKIMHWGTESYAQHNAYGMTYESISEGLDALVESYQGYNSRINFGGTFEFGSFGSVDATQWLKTILDCLNAMREMFDKSDLQNLTDELIASVSKLIYLLSLK
jgi:hypothetical protein